MQVVKRNGQREDVHFDKILRRLRTLCDLEPPLTAVDPALVAQKVIAGIFDGVTTEALDELASETAAYMGTTDLDYSTLGLRVAVSNLHKVTPERFSEVSEALHADGVLADDYYAAVLAHREELDSLVDHGRDMGYTFFGFRTLSRGGYLRTHRSDGRPLERPQHLLLRVALALSLGEDGKADMAFVRESYGLMSRRVYTHATPTLFNAGTRVGQLASCFLLPVVEDSIDGIYDTLGRCARISKSSGGIGFSISNVRATGTAFGRDAGVSTGLVPMLRCFNDTARYVNQGGKRKGAFAAYLEPWHPDVSKFIELRKNNGKDEDRARDLFLALWVPDLFMRRVEADQPWSLFCPKRAPGLQQCYGEEFDRLYERYEAEGLATRVVSARSLWFDVLAVQIETGGPYILYKDSINARSAQKNLGTIISSNLCTEIVQFSSPEEIATCTLASISLPAFIRAGGGYDLDELYRVARVVLRALDRVIDRNVYPLPEAERSSRLHRAVGVGVQGLADVFHELRLPWDSEDAARLNRNIFETIYFATTSESCALAKELGAYSSFQGSPASRGILQPDMWVNTEELTEREAGSRWDWKGLRADVAAHGLRNSMTVAPMPTASTSQILGNTESIECCTSNIYTRRVLSGDFEVVNHRLVRDLQALGMWTPRVCEDIIRNKGSVQDLEGVSEDLKRLYRTVWEIPQRVIIDMAAGRGPYIDQSQSMNIHLAEPTIPQLTAMHFYGWRKGLKTGMYYLRTKAASGAIQYTVGAAAEKEKEAPAECHLGEGHNCCSS